MGVISNQNTTTVGNTIFVNPNAGPSGKSPLGGAQRWPDKFHTWFKRDNATCDFLNRRIVVAKGQVLKRGTLLQSTPTGKQIAHGSFIQNSTVLLSGTVAVADTVTIAGITLTLTSAATPEQVARAFAAYAEINSDLISADDAAALLASNPAFSIGTFSAWVPGWNLTVDEHTVVEYNLGENTDGGSVPAIGLIASSVGYVAATNAFPTATASAAGLTISTIVNSIPGTVNVAFAGTLANTHTVTIGGVIFTAGSAGATAAQIVAALATVAAGAAGSTGTVAGGATVGALTGTNAGWTFTAEDNSTILQASASSGNSVFGVLATATTATNAAELSISASQSLATAPITGILMFDVNASADDAGAVMYTTGDFWAEGLQWENHPLPAGVAVPAPGGAGFTGQLNGYDYVVNGDGTVTACSAYWTGVQTLLDAQKLLENTAGNAWFNVGSWQERAGEIEP